MKLIHLLGLLFPLATLITAGPGPPSPNDPQVAAVKKLDVLSKQYQNNVHNTIKDRKTGGTSKNPPT